ncbi:MAG TPA: ZIP family metal transporter [Gemmatimonadales bacterium]|nr:ZIP family metal transporter [Gemmatimonadales bacterium]
MTPILWALLAAAGNLVGALVVVRHRAAQVRVLESFIAIGAGFMIAVALGEVVPEAFARNGSGAAIYLVAGYFAVHLAQHVLTPHFHFGEETHSVSPVASISALIGLLLHTFFDGVAIASGFQVSETLGILLFAAVFLHKLPEGLAMASLMLASGLGRARALLAAAALGVATVVGVVATSSLGPLREHGLALAGGVTIYVAASNLVPEFQARRGWAMPLSFFGGAAAFFAARAMLG